MKTSAQMIEELQSALHDRTLSKAEYIRIQAVLMRKLKQRRPLIAAMVGKSLSSVEDWITAYNHHGLAALRTHVPKQPNRAALTNKQRARLKSKLKKKPCDLNIGTEEYWTMDAVNQLVERETGVIYKSVNSYRKLLDEAGLSYQKVEFVDKHQNQQLHDDFQQQFEAKVKGGRISMWW
jgi:putative transposase